MGFRDLPRPAQRYILYHVLISPTLIAWVVLPYYLLAIGYEVLQVGMLFTLMAVLGIPLQLLLGKVFTVRDLRLGLAAVDAMEGLASLLYGLARGKLAPIMIVAGGAVERATGYLYFIYPAYERAVYPMKRLRETLAWHLRLPEAAVVVSYPLVGLALDAAGVDAIPDFFLLLSALHILFILYIVYAMEPVKLQARDHGDRDTAPSLRKLAKRIRSDRKLLLYVVSDVLFIAGWNLAPSLALVYLVVEKYHGSLFYVALVEASISLATIVGTYIEERIRRFSGYALLSLGTATEALALAGIVFSPPVIAYLLVLAFVIRLGDTLVFIGRREWLFNSISREEASLVTSLVSSIRRGIGIVSGLATGLLASLSPVAPYAACLVLMLLTLPIYAVARRLEAAG